MDTFNQVHKIRETLTRLKNDGKKTGFVPTMGALHEGHISLLKKSIRENDITVCSIFVNPIQFDREEDYSKYPVLPEKDLNILENTGCDIVFMPSAEEVYPEKPVLSFNFRHLDKILEGQFREGHFNGVGIVVSKLFNIIQPHRAYFGQKDIQQFKVIDCLIKDLSFNIDLRYGATVREEDGLAMSSRNLRLSDEERKQAPALYQMLLYTKNLITQEHNSPESIKKQAPDFLKKHPGFTLEYIEILDFKTFQPLESINIENKIVVCAAAYLGNVRLIDNIIIDGK